MLTLMEVRAEDAWDCSTSSVLYYVTLEPDAAELEEWRAFWTAHGAAGRTARLIGVAREDRRRRLQAMLELSKMQPSDDGRRLFADRLGDDDPMVRLSAARSLARWHDPRGAALLVRALEDGEKLTRLDALLALAGVAGSTLGFDPQAGEVERAEAVGRWREWLRRREQPGGPRDASAGVQYRQARLRTRLARLRESPAAVLRA